MFKLACVNDWYDKKSAIFTNQDGFLAAVGILAEQWEVKFFKKHDHTFQWEHPSGFPLQFQPDPHQAVLDWEPDAILFFADFSRPIIGEFEHDGIPMAIAYTGGEFTKYEHVPDIIFVESKSYLDKFSSKGLNVRQAFGTNTKVFKPMPQPKVFDAVFPATFAAWKRHELFAEAMGAKGLAIGWWQEHEPQVIEACQKFGVALLHHQSAESVNLAYNMAHTCVITSRANGGSQRTVLEAMACNVPVVVMDDSDKTTEYVKEGGGAIVAPSVERIRDAVQSLIGKEVNTRDFILKNYSEHQYAQKLKEGIESIC